MNRLLELQCNAIDQTLAVYKAPGRVVSGDVTPRWIRFKVLPSIGTKIGKIKGLEREICAALDVPTCRIAQRGAAVMIEIPRPKGHTVKMLALWKALTEVEDPEDAVSPATVLLGIADDGAPLLLRLPSPSVAHVLVAGTTGSGKTALLRTMILSLALWQPDPAELKLILIDPKGRNFGVLAGLPQATRVLLGKEALQDGRQSLRDLVRLMEWRDARGESEPPVVVVVDELVDLVMTDAKANGGASVEESLTRLTQRGREAGIHLIAATQKPTAAVISGLMKGNFPVRIVGRVTGPYDAYVATDTRNTGADRIEHVGDFVAVAAGRLHRFTGAYISEEDAEKLLKERGWWRKRSAPLPMPQPRPQLLQVASKAAAEPVEAAETVEQMAERLRPWWERNRGRWGAKSEAVCQLFGPEARPEGWWWRQTKQVIARIEGRA